MMKQIMKLCSLLIVLCIVLSCSVCDCFAIMPAFTGDVDSDRQVTSIDVTLIQRYLAGMLSFNKRQLFVGDVDNSGDVDAVDATRIQRKLAKMDAGIYTDYLYNIDPSVKNFCADYDSGMAMTGVPVTFSVIGAGHAPLSYMFEVDGVVVQERSESNMFIYTFPAAGRYQVKASVFNSFDEKESYAWDYSVTEPYDTEIPLVTSVHFNHLYNRYSSHTVTAHATGGTAPYQYCFTISGKTDEVGYTERKLGVYNIDDSAPDGEFRLTTGYVDTNTIDTPYNAMYQIIPEEGLSGDITDYATLTLIVTVKDANGAVSEPYMLTFQNKDIPE